MRTVDTLAFRAALREYLWLLDRGYPPHALLVLVGNRHGLSRDQRIVLARGICATNVARRRRACRSRRLSGTMLHVDAYNVLFTVSSYILGRCLFVGNDGFLRDAAEDHGKAHGGDLLDRCAALIADTLRRSSVLGLVFHVDSPVSHSARTADLLRSSLAAAGLRGTVVLTRSADYVLKRVTGASIATSDSAVIDAACVPVVDLARLCLVRHYDARFLRLDGRLPRAAYVAPVDRPAPGARARRSSMSSG